MIEIVLISVGILIILNILILIKFGKLEKKDGQNLIENSLLALEKGIDKVDSKLNEEFTKNREEANRNSKANREELNNSFKTFSESVLSRMTEIANLQKNQLDTFSKQLTTLTKTNEDKLDKLTRTVEEKLKLIQDDNNTKLEKMRETVDEKLQSTLEKRLGDSFKLVSERLEQVYKGLGEMQTLATGVGDLKKVLSNVKTRGVLGEYQLENILEQLLTPDQYSKNVKTKSNSNSLVEFAVKLPGREDKDKNVWLPVDSKFPTEAYQELLQAYDGSDSGLIEEAIKKLANTIKISAKDIRDKYLDPPNTTDFGIMFLPFEGLYAEVLRNVGLFEVLQKEFRVIVTGPTTLSAILNSLQMGFRTLAIEKRSSEVWGVLGAIKTEFGNFGKILDLTKKKLDEASSNIDKAGTRSRQIERKLRDVQELPKQDAVKYLGEPLSGDESEDFQEEIKDDTN